MQQALGQAPGPETASLPQRPQGRDRPKVSICPSSLFLHCLVLILRTKSHSYHHQDLERERGIGHPEAI
jgi:hypothetical protein